jgi:hypothetical protein
VVDHVTQPRQAGQRRVRDGFGQTLALSLGLENVILFAQDDMQLCRIVRVTPREALKVYGRAHEIGAVGDHGPGPGEQVDVNGVLECVGRLLRAEDQPHRASHQRGVAEGEIGVGQQRPEQGCATDRATDMRRAPARVGQRRHRDHARHLVGIAFAVRQGDGAAERVPDDHGRAQAERDRRFMQQLGLIDDRRTAPLVAVTMARTVDGGEPIPGEGVAKRQHHLRRHHRGAVDEQHVGAGPLLQDMEPGALDVDETARSRIAAGDVAVHHPGGDQAGDGQRAGGGGERRDLRWAVHAKGSVQTLNWREPR